MATVRRVLGFEVFNSGGERLAATVHAEDAAAFAALLGDGATVRDACSRALLWTEGAESQSAGDGYDAAAEVMHHRQDARRSQLVRSLASQKGGDQ